MVAFRGTLDVDAVFGGLSNIASGTTTSGSPPPPPPATRLGFTQDPPPTGLSVGGSFSVEVTAFDAQGGTATGFSGLVTVTLEGPIVVGGLNGTKSVTAVNGIATFNNLSVTGACTQCWLTATAAGLAGATSRKFDVVGL